MIGVEEAMQRVQELKKLGPPAPVKGERARSKRRVPVVAVIGETGRDNRETIKQQSRNRVLPAIVSSAR